MGYQKIHFTTHAIERYRERFHAECKGKTDGEIRRDMYGMVCDSMPDRSFLNNSGYMIKLYEKYGYNLDFEFLRHQRQNIIFVIKKEKGERKRVLTCYSPDNRLFGKRVKFKKKKNISQEIMDYMLTD